MNQVVSKITSQYTQTSENIKTIAEALKYLREDVNKMKRKNQEENGPAAKKNCPSQSSISQPLSPQQGTSQSADNCPSMPTSQDESSRPPSPQHGPSNEDQEEAMDSDEELENYLTTREDEDGNIYADLEEYFEVDDGTGPSVGDKVAGISSKALRGIKTKHDDEKLQALKKKHPRPKNIENLQPPKVEEFLWRQLKRETRQGDFGHQLAVANYCRAMVPIIKAMEAIDNDERMSTISILVKDAFKMLALSVKLTNMKRLERIQKELQDKCKSLCQEGPSATKLLGDYFQEGAKKLENTKGNITIYSGNFLGKKGGDRNNNLSSQKHKHGYQQNYRS